MKKGIISASILAALASALILLSVLLPKLEVAKESKVLGSVTVGNGYQSTTTPTVADRTNLCPAGFTASSTVGVLGSVVIMGENTGELIIYDATTTDNTKRVSAATSSLVLAQVPQIKGVTATTTGTFTFDSIFTRGLLVDHTGNNTPTTTITYRCNE